MNRDKKGRAVFPCAIVHGAGVKVSRGDEPKSVVLSCESLDTAIIALAPQDAYDFAGVVMEYAVDADRMVVAPSGWQILERQTGPTTYQCVSVPPWVRELLADALVAIEHDFDCGPGEPGATSELIASRLRAALKLKGTTT